jgi:hypothetical protein
VHSIEGNPESTKRNSYSYDTVLSFFDDDYLLQWPTSPSGKDVAPRDTLVDARPGTGHWMEAMLDWDDYLRTPPPPALAPVPAPFEGMFESNTSTTVYNPVETLSGSQ